MFDLLFLMTLTVGVQGKPDVCQMRPYCLLNCVTSHSTLAPATRSRVEEFVASVLLLLSELVRWTFPGIIYRKLKNCEIGGPVA